MPVTKVTAIKDLVPAFSVGDPLTIVPNYYKKDTVLVNDIYGLLRKEDGSLYKIWEHNDIYRKDLDKYDKVLMYDKVIAKAGVDVKDYTIINKDGVRYTGSLVRDFSKFFQKITTENEPTKEH